MTDTLKSVIEEELQKAYERGVEDGMKREHAMWQLTAIGQKIESSITYEEANPPQSHCKRCGKKLGTEVTDIHTCTPMRREWVGLTKMETGRIRVGAGTYQMAIQMTEAKLKEKNG